MPNPSEQAEAVAKWCGWKAGTTHKPSFANPSKMIEDRRIWVHEKLGVRHRLPDYAESLDAMREVEDRLAERGLMAKYETALSHIYFAQDAISDWNHFLIRATAAQRLQAAYRTIQEAALGKVMEEEKTNG